jgi:hypothetical protein
MPAPGGVKNGRKQPKKTVSCLAGKKTQPKKTALSDWLDSCTFGSPVTLGGAGWGSCCVISATSSFSVAHTCIRSVEAYGRAASRRVKGLQPRIILTNRLDLGEGNSDRQVLSPFADYYTPEQTVDRRHGDREADR